MIKRAYFDNSATTAVSGEVVEAMMPFLMEQYGNASSIHYFGQQARSAVDKARHQVAQLLNARPNEVVFTSGGTEANNLAIRGVIESFSRSGTERSHDNDRLHMITSSIEHPSVKEVCGRLNEIGVDVTYLPVDAEGVVKLADVREALRPTTVLISIMRANNEIGTLQPVAEIGQLVDSMRTEGQRIFFHTDAVQAVGKLNVDVEQIGCDLLSISAHKFHAPKGIGALYIRRGTRVKAQNIGGRQERGVRGGTESVPNIIGFGKAAELAEISIDSNYSKLVKLRDKLERGILDLIGGAQLNGAADQRLPNISNVFISGIEGEALLINLDLKGFAVSTGSACSSGTLEPSPVIQALGWDDARARGSIRLSLSKFNTDEEVDRFLMVLPEAVAVLRALSPR